MLGTVKADETCGRMGALPSQYTQGLKPQNTKISIQISRLLIKNSKTFECLNKSLNQILNIGRD